MYQLEAPCRSLLIKGLLHLWSGTLCVGGAEEVEEEEEGAAKAGLIGEVSSCCGDGRPPFYSCWQRLEASGEVTRCGRVRITKNHPPHPPSSSSPGAFFCAARAAILYLCIPVCLAF